MSILQTLREQSWHRAQAELKALKATIPADEQEKANVVQRQLREMEEVFVVYGIIPEQD